LLSVIAWKIPPFVISQTGAANETRLFELFCHAVGGRDTK